MSDAKPTPIVANTEALAKANAATKAVVLVSPADTQPCNWSISNDGTDTFHAVNCVTGRVFDGTKAEFAEILRG